MLEEHGRPNDFRSIMAEKPPLFNAGNPDDVAHNEVYRTDVEQAGDVVTFESRSQGHKGTPHTAD